MGCGLAGVLVLGPAARPAGAAGTDGVEVLPVPSAVDGEDVTSFRMELPASPDEVALVPFILRNVGEEPRTARIYATRVGGAGTSPVGQPGSSPYVVLPEETVVLQGGESQDRAFEVRGVAAAPRDVLAAVVLEVTNGPTVTQATTLVYLERLASEPVEDDSLPLPPVLAAGGLAVGEALALVLLWRRPGQGRSRG